MCDEFKLMNEFGSKRIPFLFIISYDKKQLFVVKMDNLINTDIQFTLNNNCEIYNDNFVFNYIPNNFDDYKTSFFKAMNYLKNGDSYLLNLTFRTQINTNLSLLDIYKYSNSQFKLLFQDKFVCFSPERFIEIKDNRISTNPMKGTIDNTIPNAEQLLKEDKKEIAEHYTIVDLLRNDLSLVARKVRVEKFRYIDRITTNRGDILQTSSLISGFLPDDWHSSVGDILFKITPAGSVTGAPKIRTCQIINEIENYTRGFYTGIAGIYDGLQLQSYVLIRFIENENGTLYFKSGGGITTQSDVEKEYKELLSKIYVPIVRNN